MIAHYQRKYLQKRIGEETIAEIDKDIAEFDHIETPTFHEAEALWWLKRLKCRSESVFATYKERPTGETNGQE